MNCGTVGDIKPENVRDIVEQYVNGDYTSGFSMERGKFRGLTGRARKKAQRNAERMDRAFSIAGDGETE